MRFKLVGIVVIAAATIAVTGASAADFAVDDGPCRETPGEQLLLRCPSAVVGVPYEVQLESEEGSGCTSPGNPYVWYEIVNSSLPEGLSMSRAGVISGVPTGVGFRRFWVWNHDLTEAQGGPSWCQNEDRSEHEFSIFVDPGLAIVNTAVKQATVNQPYSETLKAQRVDSLNPVSGPDVQPTWSLQSGSLPAGVTLSADGVLSGTPTAEGSYGFVVHAQNGSPSATREFTISVRQPLSVTSSFASGPRPNAEVGVRLAKTLTATGGSGTYVWSLASGALPSGVLLDTNKGTLTGVPRSAGTFALGLTATDTEGRAATLTVALNVAGRLTIKTRRLTTGTVGRRYRATFATIGGVAPVKWNLARGTLPTGVRLSGGALRGTPRRAGTFRIAVVARDGLGVTAKQSLVLLVRN
jgi:hypothetical protein